MSKVLIGRVEIPEELLTGEEDEATLKAIAEFLEDSYYRYSGKIADAFKEGLDK